MLQFIAEASDKYSIPEQVQMAIEGGVEWVVINSAGMGSDDLREALHECADLCRESGCILVIAGDAQLAKEMGLHGVQLSGPLTLAAETRAALGAEAIIGMEITTAEAAIKLADMDIDYAVADSGLGEDKIRQLMADIRGANCAIPVVLRGAFTADNIQSAPALGVSGVAAGPSLLTGDNPPADIRTAREALLKATI